MNILMFAVLELWNLQHSKTTSAVLQCQIAAFEHA